MGHTNNIVGLLRIGVWVIVKVVCRVYWIVWLVWGVLLTMREWMSLRMTITYRGGATSIARLAVASPVIFIWKNTLSLSPFQIKKYTLDIINEKWINRSFLYDCPKSVRTDIDSQHEIEMEKRKSYLKIILKSILFWAKQGIR